MADAGRALGGAASGAAAGATIGGPYGAIIGGVIGGIGGLLSGGVDTDKANALLEEAYNKIIEVGAPPDQSKEIILEKFKSAGMLTPEIEKAIDVGVSQAATMVENPEARKAQMSALNQIQERAAGGLTAQDRAAFNQNRLSSQRDQEAKRQQIIQNMQARGQGGAGAELQAALLASQAGSDEESAAGDRIAAAAAQNALSAAGQAGSLSGQVRNQDYNAQLQKAQAADELNRFNVQAQMGRQQRNISSQNQAQQYNLGQQQKILDTNTLQDNQEKLRQSEAQRQFWKDKLDYAGTQAAAKAGQAQNILGQAAQSDAKFAGVMGGISNAASAIGSQQNQQSLLDRLYPKQGQTMDQSNQMFADDYDNRVKKNLLGT